MRLEMRLTRGPVTFGESQVHAAGPSASRARSQPCAIAHRCTSSTAHSLALASSSRSQVPGRAASAVPCLTKVAPSVDARWCLLLSVVIVVHLVTGQGQPKAKIHVHRRLGTCQGSVGGSGGSGHGGWSQAKQALPVKTMRPPVRSPWMSRCGPSMCRFD